MVLETLMNALPQIPVGLAVAVALWLIGKGAGALVRRRYLRLEPREGLQPGLRT